MVSTETVVVELGMVDGTSDIGDTQNPYTSLFDDLLVWREARCAEWLWHSGGSIGHVLLVDLGAAKLRGARLR